MPAGQACSEFGCTGGAPAAESALSDAVTGVAASSGGGSGALGALLSMIALLPPEAAGEAGRASAAGGSSGRPAQPMRQLLSTQASKILARVTLKRFLHAVGASNKHTDGLLAGAARRCVVHLLSIRCRRIMPKASAHRAPRAALSSSGRVRQCPSLVRGRLLA